MKGLVVAHNGYLSAPTTGWSQSPAAMAPVANRPLLARAIETLLMAGADDVAVLCEPRTGPRLRSAMDGRAAGAARWVETTGSGDLGDALLEVEDFLREDRFVVHTTGGLWLEDRFGLQQALTLTHDDALLFLMPSQELEVGRVRTLVSVSAPAHPQVELGRSARFCGIQCFGPAFLDALRTLEGSGDRSFRTAIDLLIAEGASVRTRVADGWCPYAGRPDELLALNRAALDDLRPPALPATVVDSEVDGWVQVHPTARVRGSVLRGPVLVGADARISDAYVGPDTVVGDSAIVENAEIEASVLLTGARVQNVGVRIDESVIGEGARLGHTFRRPKALRVVLGDDASVDLA